LIVADPVPDEPPVQRSVVEPVHVAESAPPLPVLNPSVLSAATGAGPEAPVMQRALMTAPAPEPVFRELPAIAPESTSDVVSADEHSTTPDATDSAKPVEVVAAPTPPEPLAPLTSQRSAIEQPAQPLLGNRDARPAPASDAPVQRLTQSTPERPVQRHWPQPPSVQRATAALDVSRQARPEPRRLGLGAPIERAPVTATPVETISLQEWAAARDQPPPVAQRLHEVAAPAVEPPAVGAPAIRAPALEVPAVETMPLQRTVVDETSAEPTTELPAAEPITEQAAPAPAPPAVETTAVESAAFEPALIETTPMETTGLLGDRDDPLPLVSRPEPELAARPVDVDRPVPMRFGPPPMPDATPSRSIVASSTVQRMPAEPTAQFTRPERPRPSGSTPSPEPTPTPTRIVQRFVGDRDPIPLQVIASPAPSAPVLRTASAPPSGFERSWSSPRTTPVQRSTSAAFPAPQRTTTSTSARVDAPNAVVSHAVPDAGETAVAAGIAHRAADGSVVFASPPVSTFELQREPDTEPAPQPAPEIEPAPLQRAADIAEPGGEAEPSAGTTTTSATVTAASPAAAAPAANANLDDLARRLYDPLAARIKAELRLDRERFGLVTDLARP
jgi:hypothetical protein